MAPIRGERVLIADPDPNLRRQIYNRLLDVHMYADCAGDGRSAMHQLRENFYAVVLLDIALPHAGAERILEYVRGLPNEQRPVILVLAEASAARSLDVDLVQIVLRKPCDLSLLADLVQSCARPALVQRERPVSSRTVDTRTSG